MDAEAYGFKRRENILAPEIVIPKPEGLPDPCTVASVLARMGVAAE